MRPKKQILAPVILPLLVAGLLVQAIVTLLRLRMGYDALAQGLDASVIGLLSAVFSLLPIFIAVPIGRYNDKGSVARAAVMAAVCILIACLMLWTVPTSLTSLLAATAILGVGQMLGISSLQFIAMISSSRAHRDSVLGNYMVAMSLGQAVGPLLIGFPNWVYPASFLGILVVLIAAGLLLRAVPMRRKGLDKAPVPLAQIAATRGLPWIILTGSLCVTALDLLLAFMPVLGEARGLAPATVGLLLSVRALAAMVSRLLFGRAVRLVGRMRLMLLSVGLSGAGLCLLAIPLPAAQTGVVLFAIGFGLGLALTSSIALTMQIAPMAVRGTALSLRLTANRIAQFGLPLIASVAIAPLGVAGIFGITGAALLLAPVVRPKALSLLD